MVPVDRDDSVHVVRNRLLPWEAGMICVNLRSATTWPSWCSVLLA